MTVVGAVQAFCTHAPWQQQHDGRAPCAKTASRATRGSRTVRRHRAVTIAAAAATRRCWDCTPRAGQLNWSGCLLLQPRRIAAAGRPGDAACVLRGCGAATACSACGMSTRRRRRTLKGRDTAETRVQPGVTDAEHHQTRRPACCVSVRFRYSCCWADQLLPCHSHAALLAPWDWLCCPVCCRALRCRRLPRCAARRARSCSHAAHAHPLSCSHAARAPPRRLTAWACRPRRGWWRTS